MKKEYQKPTMKVYEMKSKTALLVGSNGDPAPARRGPRNHGDEFGYIPGLTDDSHLA